MVMVGMVLRCGNVWYGILWYWIWCGMVWYDMIGVVWCNMV
jgi:hypothetical protein